MSTLGTHVKGRHSALPCEGLTYADLWIAKQVEGSIAQSDTVTDRDASNRGTVIQKLGNPWIRARRDGYAACCGFHRHEAPSFAPARM